MLYRLKPIGYLGVAQFGSAPDWGSGGRKFKSCHPDHKNSTVQRYLCQNQQGFYFCKKCRFDIKLR